MQGQQGQARDSRDTEVLSCTLSSGTKGRFVLWKMEQGPHPAVGGCIWGWLGRGFREGKGRGVRAGWEQGRAEGRGWDGTGTFPPPIPAPEVHSLLIPNPVCSCHWECSRVPGDRSALS